MIASKGVFQSAPGGRGVIGIDWLSGKNPIDAIHQVCPLLVLIPSTDGETGTGLRIRSFFD